jgi:hypothetical protein
LWLRPGDSAPESAIRRAPPSEPHAKLPFGRASAGAAPEAADGALPKGLLICDQQEEKKEAPSPHTEPAVLDFMNFRRELHVRDKNFCFPKNDVYGSHGHEIDTSLVGQRQAHACDDEYICNKIISHFWSMLTINFALQKCGVPHGCLFI